MMPGCFLFATFFILTDGDKVFFATQTEPRRIMLHQTNLHSVPTSQIKINPLKLRTQNCFREHFLSVSCVQYSRALILDYNYSLSNA